LPRQGHASIVAKLIKINVGGNASTETKYTIKQNYKGVTFLNTSDQDVKSIILQAKQISPPAANNKYYIVREIMTATGIEYDFDRDISDSFGANIPVKVVQVDPKATYTNTGKFAYNITFSSPVFACSKSGEVSM
jgi:hypothetical protein